MITATSETSDRAMRVNDRPHPTSRFIGITLQELESADYSVEYLVDGVLVVGQPMLIGGPQKTLKTSVTFDLAISLITGKPFLGRFEVRRTASVAFFSGEGGFGFLQDVARRVRVFKQVEMRRLIGMTVCDRLPRLDRAEDLAALGDYLDLHKPEVAFFDPVYLAMSGADASNVLSMGERLGNIGRICAEHNTTLVLLHHLKRSREPYSPAELTDLSFSGFAEFAGQWLLLSRRSHYIPSPNARHELWLSIGGRTGHGGLYGLDVSEGLTGSEEGRYWYPEVRDANDVIDQQEAAAEAKKEAQRRRALERDAQRLVETLVKHPAGLAKTPLRDASGLRADPFGKALAMLLDDGQVVECRVPPGGNKKTPIVGYKLVEQII
ncbi:MAG TPA: hypothetical protein DD670_07625 [Planctomycetaceae bacterium]|nr:hypothetical protein [Planctomycetaceae bacterium]